MIQLPIIRLELEGVREQISHLLSGRHDELDAFVKAKLEETLNERWVAEAVTSEVEQCVRNAIKQVSNNRELQCAIAGLVADRISALVQEKRQPEDRPTRQTPSPKP